MPAGHLDIIVEQNAGYTDSVGWEDANGNLISLTGWTAKAQVRKYPDSSAVALEFTCAISTTTLTITATAAQTAAVELPGNGVWDLRLTPPTGQPVRLLQGTAYIKKDVTRA